MKTGDQIPDGVRTAIEAFLHECRKEARPFAVTEVLGAIRRMFPTLDISDIKLVNAIASRAAGFGDGDRQERIEKRAGSALAADIADESEALDSGSMAHQYGRRIEADGSWTIYDVFTGVPASICGHSVTGLSRPDATEVMTFLNNEMRAEKTGTDQCRPTFRA